MVYDNNVQLTDGSIMRTSAPPGGWSSFAALNVNNSLKKGILKVCFDETSVASGIISPHPLDHFPISELPVAHRIAET